MVSFAKNQAQLEARLEKYVDIRKHHQGNINCMMGIEYIDCDYKDMTLRLGHTVTEDVLNPIGILHGGITSWLLDTAMGVLANAFTGAVTPTINLSVNFLNSVKEGERVVIKAKVDHLGGTLVYASAKMYAGEKICASGTGTFYVLKENRNKDSGK